MAVDGGGMTPMRVTARLQGAVCLPYHPLALDALLAAAVCVRDDIPPATVPSEIVPIEIPLQREPDGRFHLCSAARYDIDRAELRHTHKRAPVEQYKTLGASKVKRVQITAGPNKSYRLPLETLHLADNAMWWYAVGDPKHVRELLALVHYVGKKRSVGLGKVVRWDVDEMALSECWAGFPVLQGGRPLRNLPADYEGVQHPVTRQYANVTYPYWLKEFEELCVCP